MKKTLGILCVAALTMSIATAGIANKWWENLGGDNDEFYDNVEGNPTQPTQPDWMDPNNYTGPTATNTNSGSSGGGIHYDNTQPTDCDSSAPVPPPGC